MDASEYFEKFIVKQIVNRVEYNPEKEEYSFNKLQISDDIISIIENEGLRYGMQPQQVREVISRVAGNIRTEPYIQIRKDRVDVAELKEGQHFRINITHLYKGKLSIDLITVAPFRFGVLDSDISGICYGDVLLSMDKVWNNSFSIKFKVFRNSKRIPNAHTELLLGKIDSIELFIPSIVNEILDSNESYCFEDNPLLGQSENVTETQNKEEGNVSVERMQDLSRKYYIWQPIQWGESVIFEWKETDMQKANSTFIIIDSDQQQKSIIQFNPLFELPKKGKELEVLMDIIFSCCKTRNEYDELACVKQIKPMKEGTLAKIKNEDSEKKWVLEKKPQVKFVYGK